MKNFKKSIALLVAVSMIVGCVIGGAVAWLVDQTNEVVNTFTYGDINIELAETTGHSYRILPGNNISKDPYVVVKNGSEDCWLFVKIEEENWPTFKETDNDILKVRYEVATGWTQLEDVPGVYYRKVDATTKDTNKMYVLAGDDTYPNGVIVVSENLTKEDLKSLKGSNGGTLPQPTLTFTAYAVQRDSNITTAADAWGKVSPSGTGATSATV